MHICKCDSIITIVLILVKFVKSFSPSNFCAIQYAIHVDKFLPGNYKSRDPMEKVANLYSHTYVYLYHRTITKIVKQDLTGVSI